MLGIGLYGNGGMDTRYPNTVIRRLGATGVDLNQAFLSVSLSQRFGQLSVGVAPILAMQTFQRDRGLGGFAAMGMSSSMPLDLSNNGFSFSFGGGVRAGVEYDFTPLCASLRPAPAAFI